MCTETTERDWVKEVGAPAYAAVAEMVAALQVDYDRLEELREVYDEDSSHGEDCARRGHAAAECTCEVGELRELAEDAGECESEEDARRRIQEDPLSLRIFGERTERRDGEWEATSYELLLGTGGPAVRIVGDLDEGEVVSARLEVQDWFKPWTEYLPARNDVLMAYVGCFCFGE